MSRQNAHRARPRSLGKRLTPKQAAFTHHYSNRKSDTYGNATRSCKRAGYKGNPGTLAVQGSRNLRHPAIREEMRTALYKQGFTPEFAAKTLMGAMRATVVRALPNGKGKLVLHRFPDHRTRLQGYDRACRLTGAIEDKQGYGTAAEREPLPFDPRLLAENRIVPLREQLTEPEKKLADKFAQFSPERRMLMRHLWKAILSKRALGATWPDIMNLLGKGGTDGPSQAESGQRDRPAFGPVGEGP